MARRSQGVEYMKRPFLVASSTLVAGIVAVLLFLRPTRTISPGPEMATPQRIPPAASSVIRSKMRRHGEQMRTLVSHVVVLDYDGMARAAGEIFDEPALARPIAGDELNGLLPPRFFDLQDAMRAQARSLVDAAAQRNSKAVADSFGALAKSCIGCHDAYLTGSSD
jgi:cytochrome c'